MNEDFKRILEYFVKHMVYVCNKKKEDDKNINIRCPNINFDENQI